MLSPKAARKKHEMILQKQKFISNYAKIVGSTFGYNLFSFKKSTFVELEVVVKECQHQMILVLLSIHSETQKHVI